MDFDFGITDLKIIKMLSLPSQFGTLRIAWRFILIFLLIFLPETGLSIYYRNLDDFEVEFYRI